MSKLGHRDIIGGGSLIAFGIAVALYSYFTLNMGTLSRMGPGMFPTALGLLLAGFGVIIFVQGLLQPGDLKPFEWRVAISITASIIAFGLTVRVFGMIPAVMVLIFIASRADSKATPLQLAGLLIIAPALTWLIFIAGLGVPLPALRWPF